MSAEGKIAVLVLDDEVHIRKAVSDYLQDEGRFETWGAATAAEALGILEQGRIQVCLVDLRLKGIDGFAFLEQAQTRFPAVRFLIQTGSYEADVRERAGSLGIAEERVLLKPFRLETLVRAIDRALEG